MSAFRMSIPALHSRILINSSALRLHRGSTGMGGVGGNGGVGESVGGVGGGGVWSKNITCHCLSIQIEHTDTSSPNEYRKWALMYRTDMLTIGTIVNISVFEQLTRV